MLHSFFEKVQQFIFQKFLPWFIQEVWPAIKDEIIAMIKKMFAFLRQRIEELLSNRSTKQQEDMNTKAEEAESKAKSSKDEVESARWQGKAEAYREQAENLKTENEKLRRELERIMNEEINNVESTIDNININIKDSNSLEIGSKTIFLLDSSESDLD